MNYTKHTDRLKSDVLNCFDLDKMRRLALDAVRCIEETNSMLALSRGREEQLKKQIERQKLMIENLEKTLWKK